ncbi:MAG: hypothetical protein COW27_01690 [Nitrosopumilales archaeon CG15_BIG_FIL_POST_REV_8_21_14_020_37_12]|nr:MAG: hypothetical protein COW27_01690 [Nitrosopumilales archaeon CG15_BIG_FIL_POST_REV_8_21_14_020_37_12]
MQTDIRQNIQTLKNDILKTENDIEEFLKFDYIKGAKRSIHQLELNLKYLSVIANGAPIDKTEDRDVMEFLMTHYIKLQKFTLLY